MARRGKFGKAALLMGAAAVAAGVLLKRDKVSGLLSPGSRDTAEPSWAPSPPPAPANYDAPGPVANTATAVPAPEPFTREEDGSIDEQAEEAAAAAEAANIGGQVSDYAAVQDPDLDAGESDRPLVEAGEGSSEGQEQAEAALADAASQPAEGGNDYERQIDDTIEQAGRPFSGERLEPVSGVGAPADIAAEPVAAEPVAAEPLAPEPVSPEPQGQIPFGTDEPEPEPPAVETPGVPPTDPEPPAEAAAEEPAAVEQITPAAPQTGGWQPPEPDAPEPEQPAPDESDAPTEAQPAAAEPASSDPAPPAEEQPLPDKDDEEDGGDDWRTWSGRAINP